MSLSSILSDHNPWWSDPGARRALRYPARRDLQKKVLEQVARLEERRAVVLVGPRQVGKTVLLLQVADDLLDRGWPPKNLTYFSFDDDRLKKPVSPRDVVDASPTGVIPGLPRLFLLDEIRRAPRWDLWLKQAVDRTQDRIVVTDSSAGILRNASRESGLGRWDEHHMEGLSFREYLRITGVLIGEQGEDVVVEERTLRRIPNPVYRYLAAGGFPEHVHNENFEEVRERLRRDIADRAVRRDLAGLGVDVEQVKTLLVYLVENSGSIFNATARAQDMQADPRSVRTWASLLEDALLVVSLGRHGRRASARLGPRPRFYAADHGLVVAFAPVPRPLEHEDVRGRAFEAVVFRHLRDVARELGGTLSYFRQAENLEVDFVLEGPRGPVAIEVTGSASPRPEKVERLKQAGTALRTHRTILIYGGPVQEIREAVSFVPLQGFLSDPLTVLGGGVP